MNIDAATLGLRSDRFIQYLGTIPSRVYRLPTLTDPNESSAGTQSGYRERPAVQPCLAPAFLCRGSVLATATAIGSPGVSFRSAWFPRTPPSPTLTRWTR
jgi:hypothetical protein